MSEPSSRQIIVFSLVLGCISGWPLLLTSTTLQVWWLDMGYPIISMAWLTWLGWPYLLKFLWAPYLDRLTRWDRRTTVILLQVLVGLFGLGLWGCGALNQPTGMIVFAAWMAWASATLDSALDGYRLAWVPSSGYPLLSSMTTLGYRMALVVTGGLALVLAAQWGWLKTYGAAMAVWGVGMLVMWAMPRPPMMPIQDVPSVWRRVRVLLPSVGVLLWLVGVRFGDGVLSALAPAFFLKALLLSKTQLGWLYKGMGMGASVFGSLVGGWVLQRWTLRQVLITTGIASSCSLVGFVVLSTLSCSLTWTVAVVGLESFATGMLSTAVVVWMLNRSASQTAAMDVSVLTAVMALPRVVSGPLAAHWVSWVGWSGLFGLLVGISCWPWWLVWRHPSVVLTGVSDISRDSMSRNHCASLR